jgi:hypothetical protein
MQSIPRTKSAPARTFDEWKRRDNNPVLACTAMFWNCGIDVDLDEAILRVGVMLRG